MLTRGSTRPSVEWSPAGPTSAAFPCSSKPSFTGYEALRVPSPDWAVCTSPSFPPPGHPASAERWYDREGLMHGPTAFGPCLVSPRFDATWFVAPGLAAAGVGVWIGITETSLVTDAWIWVAGVLLVDVAHVWASLYRTYLCPIA